MRDHKNNRKRGMTFPELLISTTIFGLVVLGSTSSAILLAKIATDHENRAEFSTDLRIGMEQMSYDVRNAQDVDTRTQKKFTLVDKDGQKIIYKFDTSTGKVTRQYRGNTIDIFDNVVTFDVLMNADDAPNGMTFNEDEIAIESLEFEASNSTRNATNQEITQFVLKGRNL